MSNFVSPLWLLAELVVIAAQPLEAIVDVLAQIGSVLISALRVLCMKLRLD